MEFIGDDKFALYFMRYTGEWVGIHDSMSVDESMEASIKSHPHLALCRWGSMLTHRIRRQGRKVVLSD